MARDQDGASRRGLLAQQPADPADARRVQAVRRLVEHQDVGTAEQGGRDRQALAHAHGVALDAPVGGVLEPDRREDGVDPVRGVPTGRGEHAQVLRAVRPGWKAASSRTAPTRVLGRSSSS
jgi:hypothetical protein